MVQFNTKDNEILVKIVFYGTGLSGKTTNLQKLHDMMDPGHRTDLFSVNTMEDRTLFFDLLPVDLGFVHGNSIKLQIYTVPGQVHYDSTRRIVLSGADGVIFVADSDNDKLHDNVQSLNNLYHNLQANRLNIKEVPLVMQYNKRDLSNCTAIEVLNQKLNFRHVPYFESIAIEGKGVLETFVEAVKLSVRYIFEKYQLSKNQKNVDGIIQKLEESIKAKAQKSLETLAAASKNGEPKKTTPNKAGKTVLKYTHTVQEDDHSSQEQLLQKALNSNMETARLYAELKNSQQALVKKNDELSNLYKQLEKTNADNMKMRRYLENLVNFAGEAIITFNEHWIIQNWNQAAQELFGYKKEEVLNKNVNIFFPEESMGDLNRVLQFVVNGKVVKGFETRLVPKGGGLIPVTVTFSPIKNQNNTIIAFTGIVRDLSFMSRVNAKVYGLQSYEAVASSFHEIVDESIRALSAGPKPGQVNELSQSMNLVSGYLTDVKSNETAAESLQINDVVQDVHDLLLLRMRSKNVVWTAQLNPKLPKILAERNKIFQCLLNFSLNALDSLAGVSSPKITIGTHFNDKEVMMQLIDNGSGGQSSDLGFSFGDGERVGLQEIRTNTAREILKEYSSSLRVDSAPGKGTKVTIRFPR